MAGTTVGGMASKGLLLAGMLFFCVRAQARTSELCARAEARPDARELPFEALARAFVNEIGAPDGNGATPQLDEVLEQRFVRVPLGAFEVLHPAAHLSDPAAALDLKKVCAALVDSERAWIAWIDPKGERSAAAAPALARLGSWVASWDPRTMGRADGAPRPDEALEQASSALAAAVRDAAESRARRYPVRIALLPQRSTFVGFLCFVGWTRPDQRGNFWVPGIETWTHSFLDDLEVYAMQYASPGGSYPDAMSMRYRSATGLEEQVVQLALGDLLERLYGGALPPSFVGAAGNNLVIELFGEVDTRVDGDLSGRRTEARETFVPGGLSQGGVLPKNRAESAWRSERGEGYFVGLLREAQKEGRKAKKLAGRHSSSPDGSFVLESASGDARCVVGAPVLGPAAAAQAPAPPLDGEYQEFLRAYRSAFLHWLQLHGAGSESDSRAAFAGLFGALAQAGENGLVGVLEKAYGVPLSDAEASEDTLEGRFLDWLSKQKATRAR